MKKILVLLTLMITAFVSAQEVESKESSRLGVYGALGLSIGNSQGSDFEHTSYPSVEAGISKDNVTLGLAVGRSNLADFGKEFKDTDNLSNYWYEAKTTVSQPIGVTNGYLVFGLGNYINTSQIFIEYGVGISYMPNKIGYFVQASNWDGVWYNSVGLSFNLR